MNIHILRAALFCRTPEGGSGLPVLIWGPPGSGKTALLRQAAEIFGLSYLRLSPAERSEGAFGVVPVPGADGYLHYPAPLWVQQFTNGGLLLIDELGSVPPSLQAPLLGLVQFRTIGDFTLNQRVRVLGAANETRHAAGGWDLAPALANRFGHYEYSGLDSDAWAAGLLDSFVPQQHAVRETAADLEARVEREWATVDAQARGMVAGFIQRNPGLLHKEPTKGSADHAWPSRRTVEYASVALASATLHGLNESDTDELMSGFVGRPWVTEFRQWTQMLDLPLPADVLDGAVRFAHDERRPDRTLVVLGACAALIVPPAAAKRKERAAVFWRLVEDIAKVAPDFAVGAARAVVKSGLIIDAQKSALRSLLPVLQAAGL